MLLEFTADCTSPCTVQTLLRARGISARQIIRLKSAENGITVNGMHARTVDSVQKGDRVRLCCPEEPCSVLPNPALRVDVVYESAQLLVCEKPADMPSHPSMLHRDDTLANWFAAYAPGSGFHLVTRLDRNTTGLCLIAKTSYAAHALRGRVEKLYYALIPPGLTGSGTVDAPIARESASVIRRCVRTDGRAAVTHYRVLHESDGCTLVALIPETGRTHQLRVHMAYLGYPLLGDDLYGGDCSRMQHHALHCGRLRFPEPDSGETVTISSESCFLQL